MQFGYYMPAKVYFGRNCIRENGKVMASFGRRALIVTGSRSARESGALADVLSALHDNGISCEIYDRVTNNPTLENVEEGGMEARKYKADFIIGIGGGSPLDAAKAVAVLAVNDMKAVDLFGNNFANHPLPIAAVPTTAGTGSEVTPYSILTRSDIETKMSFGNDSTFPAVAFMDAAYTESMSYDVTVNTAVDALSHSVEGYLSNRSTPVSDILALEAIGLFGQCLDGLLNNSLDFTSREKLLYASMLGGMVITHTGTTIIHGMGYNLTYFKGLPHGKANGLLMKEYLEFNYEAAEFRTDRILQLLKSESISDFGCILERLMKTDLVLSSEEIEKFSRITMKQRSTLRNPRKVEAGDIADIYGKVFR